MSKSPVTIGNRALRAAEQPAGELVDPSAAKNSWVSFRYSYTEVTSAPGGRAHVKSRRASFEDGKLASESFEGEVERGLYDQWVEQAHQQVATQTALLLRTLGWFLPGSGK